MYYKDITFKELQSILNENTVLIDVRNEDEYKEYNLPNSTNLPLSDITLDKIINLCNKLCEEKLITKNKPINLVFYCKSGGRSIRAIDSVLEDDIENNVLLVQGYKFNIYNLKGGIISVTLGL